MPLLSVTEASTRSSLTGSYLRRLLASGAIKGKKLGGATWAIDERSLTAFLKKERRPGPKAKKKSR